MKPEIDGANIVLLGSFNTQIFQPAWFALQGLIRKEAADAAKIEFIHPQIVSIIIESVKFEVTLERFTASTSNPSSYELLRDLTLGSFHILQNTPIGTMGFNRNQHFKLPSEKEWNAIGDRLAPKELWKQSLKMPGLRTLVMEGVRTDDLAGYMRVRIEPSPRVHPGVYISVNNHFVIRDFKPEQGCGAIMDILKSNWDSFFETVDGIVSSIMESK